MRLEMTMLRLNATIKTLDRDLKEGYVWTVINNYYPIEGPWHLPGIKRRKIAEVYMHQYRGYDRDFRLYPTRHVISQLKKLFDSNKNIIKEKELIHIDMNLNNLEDLKDEMKRLGFKDKLITQMEEHMKNNVPDFRLHDIAKATKGQVDLTLHFKQSGQSEFYYFNKFETTHNQGKTLDEGQRYVVITQPQEEGKQNLIKSFMNTEEAINYFKKQTGNSELAIGKGETNKDLVASKSMMANMENGKVNYVNKEFQRTYYGNPITQTFWIEKGRGFKAEQAVNLIQGRYVYRDDMMNLSGEPYKAWVKLDFDKGKDRFQNYSTNQFHDPQYGFDLSKVLDKFNLKELEDPTKRTKLEESLRNGNRAFVTTEKDGQPLKLFVEAVPRYSQINMYAENGKPEKREQFLKEPSIQATLSKDKSKEQGVEQRQGVRM